MTRWSTRPNAQLRPGGGATGAIHRAAEPALDKECRVLAPIRPGQTVISGGHSLPNRYVIRCLELVWELPDP